MVYSIITPVYNRADCIARCMNSVLRNLRWNIALEHIIVDDGSEDDTSKIVEEYSDKYEHVRFIRFAGNRGTNAARNAAIAAATGDFCVLLDSDDYFVDDAIRIIDAVVSSGSYSEYLFAANDMTDAYKRNPLLGDRPSVVLTFEDFLYRRVSGDFIHVLKTGIIQRYPFDEGLRIYEGPFFMRFYRESRNILFTDRIVTIRERNRADSVTRYVIFTDKKAVERIIRAYELVEEWFKDDFMKSDDGRVALYHVYLYLLEQYVSLNLYSKAGLTVGKIHDLGYPITIKLQILYQFRLGFLYDFIRASYLKLKYEIFNIRLQ